NNEFSSDKEDKFTCLSWGKVYDEDLNGKVDTPPPKKKKKLSTQIQQFSKVIALGLQNGSIAIYSIAHGGIVKTLSGLSISKFNAILAISETGTINIFRDVNSRSPVQLNKKKKRFTTQTPDCIIKVLNENDNTVIPIISACFLNENENEESGFIMIARGNTVKPIFEKVEETLETKLKDLDLMSVDSEMSQQSSHASKFKTLQGNSMQQMLVQALHSNDDHLFCLVLEQTSPDIVNNTVRKLPTRYIIPFLEKVITRFYEKPKSVMNMLQWIKAVPDLTHKLSNFYQALDSRSAVFQKLLNFQGRLDLIMQQIAMRKTQGAVTTNGVETVYVESSSDDISEDGLDIMDHTNESINEASDSDD
ncbi:9866_t:CDS:2, partial [Racocetra fulgida]